MCQISYDFLHSIFCKVKSCMYANLSCILSWIFPKKSYNVEPLFNENLYLQSAFHWILLSFGCCFDIWQSRMHQENKVYCGSKDITEGPQRREYLNKWYEKLLLLFFFLVALFFLPFVQFWKVLIFPKWKNSIKNTKL